MSPSDPILKAERENRQTFFERLEPFFPPSILLDVQLAYTLAKFGHRAQFRKDEKDAGGEPLRYFEHVRRVSLILIDEAQIVNREMVLAALLHDGVEDTRDLTPEMIEHCFGSDVVSLVKTLSKVPKEGYLETISAQHRLEALPPESVRPARQPEIAWRSHPRVPAEAGPGNAKQVLRSVRSHDDAHASGIRCACLEDPRCGHDVDGA